VATLFNNPHRFVFHFGYIAMAHDLDIRSFFRKAPRNWLRRYFEHVGVLRDFDWNSVGKNKIDPLNKAFLALEDALRQPMVADFRNIAMLATASGKLAMIDEAAFHREVEGFAEKLGSLEDFHACAFWTCLERPQYWNGAVFFAAADGKPKRYWRSRINMPALGRTPTQADANALGAAVGRYFKEREGRGGYCTVHPCKRGKREHYFLYPKDHSQTSIEYETSGEMTKRPYNPAFEIIMIHDDAARTLDIWHHGSADRVKDLQVLFARTILGAEIPRESPRDTRVYDLERFLSRDFLSRPSPELGIRHVSVRKIRALVLGHQKHTIRIDLGAECPDHVLFDRLEGATAGMLPAVIRVSLVGITAEFELRDGEEVNRKRNFEIAWPNSCTLESNGDDGLLRRLLQENDIVPRSPRDEERDATEEG
jgi:hypothetical protein